jgi:beta propeller repeat protein
MRSSRSALAVLALSCALLLALSQSSALAGYEYPICTWPAERVARNAAPGISDAYYVWAVWPDSSMSQCEIRLRERTTGRERAIATADWTGVSADVRVDGNFVVWSASNVIYAYDILASRLLTICATAGSRCGPDISGTVVVWQDQRNGSNDIYGFNIANAREFAVCTEGHDQTNARISGNIVVWTDYRRGLDNADIYGYDLSTGREFPVCTASGVQRYPAVSGNIVVWQDCRNETSTFEGDIYGKDLSSGQEFAVCMAPDAQWYPAVSGSVVVWQDSRGNDTHIYAKDLVTNQEIPVCVRAGIQTNPAISGHTICWLENLAWPATELRGYRLDGYGGPPTTLPDQPWLPDWPIAGPVYPYPTQLHAHYRHEFSRWWDMTPNELAGLYRYEHGYSFTAATEHYPQYSWDGGFWDTTGAEAVGRITDSFEDTGAKHILGIGFDHTRMDLGLAGSQSHEVERVRNIQRAGGGIAIAAHPNDSKYKWEDWVLQNCASQAGLAGVEVFNAGVWLAPGGYWYADATWMWDSLLERGHVVWGTAGDDFTNPWPQEDDACVVIVSPSSSLSAYGAMSALRRGAFYSCRGGWRGGAGAPVICGWWAEGAGDDTLVHLVTPRQYPKVEFVANGRSIPANLQQRPDGRYEATYTMQVDGYVRAAVSDGQPFPAISWTQPIFIGRQGTQTFMWTPTAGAASRQAAPPVVIDFDQAHLEISQPQSDLAGTVYGYLLPPSDRPPTSPPMGYIGSCYRFLPGSELDGANTLRLGYDPQDVTLVPQASLAIYWFDPDQEAWVELPSTFDEVGHTVTAAITHLGTFAVSAPMPEETSAPGVSILTPASGGVLTGVQTISADAWDDNGVASVQFYLGDLPLGTDLVGTDGWTCGLDCSRYPPGPYVVAAVARDAAGNEGRAEVNVTLTGGAPAPTLTIISPASGATIAGALHAQGTWSDDEAPLKVIATLGEIPVGLPVQDVDGTWSLDATVGGVPAGPSQLIVAGEDAAGNPVSATVEVVVPAAGQVMGQVRATGTGVSIAGAKVAAYLNGDTCGATTTDAMGLYAISSLLPGQYVVAASAQGYLMQTKAKIAVVSGETTYVNFNLQASGRLTGQVREKGTGANIEGATVTAYLNGRAQATAVTGVNGIYLMDAELPPGAYAVTVTKAGYVTQTKWPIAIAAGVTSYCNFFAFERAPSVKGQVRELGTGTPIAGATVSINAWGALTGVVTATTDANGIYAFPPGLPSGTYTLWASKIGYVTQTKANIATTEDETTYVNFNLQVSGKLKGQVRDRVTGASIVGATVKARMGGILRATATTTAPYGIYEMDRDLPAGSYVVEAIKPGYQTQTKVNIVVSRGATTYVNFSLLAGASVHARIQGAPVNKLAASLDVRIYPPGGSGTPLLAQTVLLDRYGQGFLGFSLPAGTYDVWGKEPSHLAKRITNWAYAPGTDSLVDFSTLLAGDLVNNNVVDQADYDYYTSRLFTNDPIADINRDGVVNTGDYSFIVANWNKTGDQ